MSADRASLAVLVSNYTDMHLRTPQADSIGKQGSSGKPTALQCISYGTHVLRGYHVAPGPAGMTRDMPHATQANTYPTTDGRINRIGRQMGDSDSQDNKQYIKSPTPIIRNVAQTFIASTSTGANPAAGGGTS